MFIQRLYGFIAALPLALTAPHKRSDFYGGCGQADRPRSAQPYRPSPSWPHSPYLPVDHDSSLSKALSDTGHVAGTAPCATSTGYPVYLTGTARRSGVVSILPIQNSSSTFVYTHPIRSSSALSADGPLTRTPRPPPEATPPSTTYGEQPSAVDDDTFRSQSSSSTTWAFSNLSALPTGLRASTDFISSGPLTHTFAKANVQILEEGMLNLLVPGGQGGQQDISSAEIATEFPVKYASVRTWAILSEEPGVCNGMFLYKSDSQETDIEWISGPQSQSNKFANNGSRAMQYTNQALNGVHEDASSAFGRAAEDATSAIHEYRLDWLEDRTDFFLDGVLQHSLTTNVPNEAGPWVWNNWANGDKGWTADPPKNDAEFKIQKIEIYYNPE